MKRRWIGWGMGVLMATGVLYAYENVKEYENSTIYVSDNPDQYCAKMKDGKLVVMHNGTAITTDIFLKNGTTVKPDGTVINKDGVRTTLNEGECVDGDGKINRVKISEPYQKEE